MDNYLTLKEASKLLRVSRSTIYKLATSGEIPAAKIGKMWRVDRNALEKYFKHSDLISAKSKKKINVIKNKILNRIDKISRQEGPKDINENRIKELNFCLSLLKD